MSEINHGIDVSEHVSWRSVTEKTPEGSTVPGRLFKPTFIYLSSSMDSKIDGL